jgi:hypothetical protein
MRDCPIQTYAIQDLPSFEMVEIQIHPERGHIWIQKACKAILDHFGCAIPVRQSNYRRVVIDKIKMMDWIMEHAYNVQWYGPTDIDRIVMGHRQFFQLTYESINYPFDFDLNTNQWRGYKVQVIPWIDGCFALPKERR